MDAPIISIYDMLLKRHRQQKKEELGLQKEVTSGSTGRQNNASRSMGDRSTTESKKAKEKSTRAKTNVESKEKHTPKMPSNVITATHLTKKHTGILMPPLTKKEVLNQLIERMTNSSKKNQEKPISNESTSPGDDDSDRPIISIKKMKPKPKNPKPIPGSASSHSRRRLALSPRNTNTMGTPKLKREKPIKPKDASTPKILKTDPNKRHLQSNKSKISIVSKKEDRKTPSENENGIRYRL